MYFYIDLEKSITRAQAKATHPKLPDGGAWRTIKGHHVYIKDGQVVAGAGVGKTGKPIKLTKQHLSAHQEHVNKQAKKKAPVKQAKPKKTTASKAPVKQAGTKKTATVKQAPAKKAPTAKAPVKQTAPKKTAPVKQTPTKTATAPKPPVKQATPKATKAKPLEKMTAQELDKHIDSLFEAHTKAVGPHKYAQSQVDATKKKALHELMLERRKIDNMRKSKKKETMYKENDTKAKAVQAQADADRKAVDAKHKPGIDKLFASYKEAVKHRDERKASAPKPKATPQTAPKKDVQHGKYHTARKNPKTNEMQYEVAEGAVKAPMKDSPHEYFYHTEKTPGGGVQHRISEASTGLLVAIGKTKPMAHKIAQDLITKNTDKLKTLIDNHLANYEASPYMTKPTTASAPKDNYPTPTKPTAKPKKATKPKAKASEPVVLYHGTEVHAVSAIKETGFRRNGTHNDFGHAVYFKSPAYDKHDHKEQQDKLAEWEKQGKKIMSHQLDRKGADTKEVVEFFAGKQNPAVLQVHFPKEHVLDCTNGRPSALTRMIKDFEGETKLPRMLQSQRAVLKHFFDVDVSKLEEQEIKDMYNEREQELFKALGHRAKPQQISPYEVYASKHNIGAIVDKLDDFQFEGWQVGVYKPELLKIMDHGKGIQYNAQGMAELEKALRMLMKAMSKQQGNGYTMLHHELTEDGLILHVGVIDDTAPVQKSHAPYDDNKGGFDVKIYNVRDLNIINGDELTKSASKEKLTGGEWRTVRGQHVYIKGGTIQTGPLKGRTLNSVQGGDKANDDNGKQQATSKTGDKPTSVGEKATTDSGGNGTGPSKRGQSEDGGGSGKTASPIRDLSKKAIPARSEREYTFHQLEGKEGAGAFHKAIMDAKAGNDHGAFVHAYEQSEYAGMKMFLSEGGEAGFAMKGNGDICSLFHNPKIGTKKGVLGHSIELGLQHGGNRLDCFDGFLPKQYAKWGFEPVAKVPFNREYAPEGWNFERDGEPDVLFFAHNGDSLDKVLETNYPMPDLSKTPTIEDYDDGEVHQDAYLEGRKSPVTKSLNNFMGVMKSLAPGYVEAHTTRWW